MIGGAIAVWAWSTLRLFALLRVQAIWREASGGAWTPLALLFAAFLAAAWSPEREGSVGWTAWLIGAVFEVLLGTLLGVLASLPGEAALGAARHSGAILGIARSRAWAALHLALTGSLALALGLHRPLLAALRQTVSRWPVGDPVRWRLDLDVSMWTEAVHGATLLALGLATPVLLTAALAEFALAAVSRGALVAVTAALRPWLVAWAALAALGAAWTSYPEAWLRALPSV